MTLVEQPDTDELPYRWARFVGGFTVVLGLLGFAAGLMRLDWRAVVGSVIGLGIGFGIYEQRKWAVMLVEALTCLTVASAVWSLAEGRSHEKHIVAVILVLFYAPQILYFWKRHKQLR